MILFLEKSLWRNYICFCAVSAQLFQSEKFLAVNEHDSKLFVSWSRECNTAYLGARVGNYRLLG